MQYYGNLAVQPERKTPGGAPGRRPQADRKVRRRSIPVYEKLLYLLTVALLVAVASFIVYRYAEIYQTNRQIQNVSNGLAQIEADNKQLEQQIRELSDPERIRKMAESYGMVPNTDKIMIKDGSTALAMR
jgi:cell division protein FtsL